METADARVQERKENILKSAENGYKMLEKSLSTYLGSRDRGFESRSPDQLSMESWIYGSMGSFYYFKNQPQISKTGGWFHLFIKVFQLQKGQ